MAFLFGLLAWLGITLTRGEGRIAAIWAPNAVLLAVLLRRHAREDLLYLPAVYAANIAANLLAGDSLARAMGLGFANIVEIVLVWRSMAYFQAVPFDPSRNRDLLCFAGSVLLGTMVSGIIATPVLTPENWSDIAYDWWAWVRADALSLVLVTPSLTILADAWGARHWPTRQKMVEVAGILALGTAVSIYVFWQTAYPFLFLDALIVLLYVFRLGPPGVAIGILNVAIIASIATSIGRGPINLVQGGLSEKLLVLQIFLASSFMMGLPVAATLMAKKRVEEELRLHRDMGRSIMENTREAIFRTDAEHRWTYLNPAWEELTGKVPEQSLGETLEMVIYPEDWKNLAGRLQQLRKGTLDNFTHRFRLIHEDCTIRHVELGVTALYDDEDQYIGFVGSMIDLTIERRSRLALEQSEERFRRLSDSAPLGICRVDLNGYLTYCNDAFAELLDLTREQARGDMWKRRLIDPESWPPHGDWRAIAGENKPFKWRVGFRKLHGEQVVTTLTAVQEYDERGDVCGTICVLLDITREEEATETILAAKRTFETLANLSPAGIFRTDPQGACTYVNPSWCELAGLKPADALGSGWTEAIHPADRLRVSREWQESVRTKSVFRTDFRFLRHNSDIAWVDALSTPELDDRGDIVGFVGVNVDITDRKTLENELVTAKRTAEMASSTKAKFLANMSHEIRTPMNGVLGFAELLLHSDLDEDQHKYVSLIAESGRTMMQLLNDILDISKIEAGHVVITHEPTDLRHLLKGCCRLMQAEADRKGLPLTLDVDDAIPAVMLADSLRLRQIVLNLVGNALKFTAQGHVAVRASLQIGRIGQREVVVDVEDTGPGIPAMRAEAIFRPFEQLDDSTQRQYGGTGLGLPISRQLAELMGGHLQLRSEEGRGSTFTLSLPLDVSESGDVEVKRHLQAEPVAPGSLAGEGHILLVEDHEINQVLLTHMLEGLGYTVELAGDGAEAIDILGQTPETPDRFDLVLMDMQMPVVDGIRATRILRAGGLSPEDLPIIALTANAFEEDIQTCRKAGMQDHLAKPVSREMLARMLHKWIGRKPDKDKDELAETGFDLPEELQIQYRERRQFILDRIDGVLRSGFLSDEDAGDLEEHLHKLAGTAGLFGEAELGEQARELESALRNAGSKEERLGIFRRRAQAMLQAA
ncbi:PAS domain S-box protein [Altericroceibacterium spongiae]|nr:PAS domain S-box protein [Altericroceibacterium spongiae]